MTKVRWHGLYTDAHGREEITVDAHGNQVTTVLRGVTFTGNALDDLAPVTALAPDAPFALYYEALCACTIEWAMAVSLDTPVGVRQANLNCTLTLGDPPDRPGLYYENLEAVEVPVPADSNAWESVLQGLAGMRRHLRELPGIGDQGLSALEQTLFTNHNGYEEHAVTAAA